ncbi:hypothetical protein EJB05_01840 [Eragrostis curvula]|uniref:FBD domain-containing protein n=1 Tax=Eragrostis curvula TaxID=38414 RepID=A0A5J9WQQ7_9POAL|nr:hypothetical protein EJB05_01840 [Eragrostis curvula]
MAQSSGEVAAKRTKLSPSGADAGEDHFSALHDDILVLILLRLGTIAEAVRTSVLSRRWRRTWALLPELAFCSAPDNRHVLEVLAAPDAPALRRILVVTKDDAPASVGAWLPLAAGRLSGDLMYHNSVEGRKEEEGNVTIALPCFGKATKVVLNLGFFALALPSTGTFTVLTDLFLERVRFRGTCELGEVVSSPRCPCLLKLIIRRAWGVARLTIQSESLLQMDLSYLNGLQQLNIDAPVLNEFNLHYCFGLNQQKPIANISAPQLMSLLWRDVYDPSYVRLGNLGQQQRLSPSIIMAYGGHHHNRYNREVLQLLQHFQVIQTLNIVLGYPQEDIGNFQYLMEDITHLPHVTFLSLYVMNGRHAFGASSFHVLRLCTGIRRLSLVLHTNRNLEAQSTCPSSCICDQPTIWKIDKLLLNCLQEVAITNLKGAEHEFAFVERLLSCAGVLEKLRITFDYSVSKSKAKELHQRLSCISRPETQMEYYMYRDMGSEVRGLALARR